MRVLIFVAQFLDRAPDFGHGALPLLVVQRLRQRNANLVDQVIQHQISKSHRQQFVVQVGPQDERDFGAVPLLGLATRQDRDRNSHQVERVTRRVGRVVSVAHPPQLVKVIDVPLHLIQIDGRFEADAARA